MKICVVCKTPIQEGLEIQTASGEVHPGPCLQVVTERDSTLNESEGFDEVQMIM